MSAVYLDFNATAQIRPEAAKAAMEALGVGGNPSSVHAAGRAARRIVDEARDAIAALVGVPADGIVFTSGATEANAMALAGDSMRRLIVAATEHVSVLENARATSVRASVVPVDADGLLRLDRLEAALAEDARPALVSVMLANNETGVVQPIAEIARRAHAAGALLHCDIVQAVGRLPVDMPTLGIDLATLSGHKIGGPQGVGALALRPGLSIRPMILGGSQEGRRRGGTENVSGIAGFGAAARAAKSEIGAAAERQAWRDRLEAALLSIDPRVSVFGAKAPRLWNTASVAMPGVTAETQVIALDLAGIAVSAGSACSSGKVERSHVLEAMGVAPEIARTAIRFSLGWSSKSEDIDRAVEAWAELRRRTWTRAAA